MFGRIRIRWILNAVSWIRICIRTQRIHMFLHPSDLHPDPLVTSKDPAPNQAPDPAPDPSIIKQK